jgi:amidase
MIQNKPLWQWSACDLAAAIGNGDITSLAAVESVVARMQEKNPELNAVVVDLSQEAVAQARTADDIVRSGGRLGPLHGVPVTIKVNTDVKGQPNSNGIKAMAGCIAPDDAAVVGNLRKAGAVILGLTNTPEFSMRMMTDNPLYGLTVNPWQAAFTCGGSSGGAAVALAAGFGPVAQGNDIGGSLRLPAFCCGVCAIRPTLGRVPAYNPSQTDERAPAAQLFSVQGPLAREIRDLRLALGVMAHGDARDPWWVPVPLEGLKTAHPIRVAVTKSPAGDTPHRVIAEALDKAAGHLADAGYAVEAVEAPFSEELAELWKSLIFTEMWQLQESTIRAHGSKAFHAFLDECYNSTRMLDGDSYIRALMGRTRILRQWLLFLEDFPLVLAPLALKPAFQVDEDIQGRDKAQQLFTALRPSYSINALGLPSVAIPAGLHEEVPYGLQIVGPRFREDLCLDAAEVLERKTGILPQRLWENF